jgi:hypothetical protein
LQGHFFKNKEILNGWKEIMLFENGSTVYVSTTELYYITGGPARDKKCRQKHGGSYAISMTTLTLFSW